MATATPATRDIETLKKDLAGQGKRVDGILVQLNQSLVSAKRNDDRIEALVTALEARVRALEAGRPR